MEQHLDARWDDCWWILERAFWGVTACSGMLAMPMFFGGAHVCNMHWEVVGKPNGDYEGLFAMGTA